MADAPDSHGLAIDVDTNRAGAVPGMVNMTPLDPKPDSIGLFDRTQPVASTLSLLLLALNLVSTSAVAGACLLVVPKFSEIFKDFDMELPRATQWLLKLSHAPLVVGALAVVGCGLLIVLQLFSRRKRIAVFGNLLFALSLALIVAIMVLALFLPLPMLVEGVMQQK